MGHVWTWLESKGDDFFAESENSSRCQSLLGSPDSGTDLDLSRWRKTDETAEEELEESSSQEEDSQMESSDALAWDSASEGDREEAEKFRQDVLLRFLSEVTHLMEPLCISNTFLAHGPQPICTAGEQKRGGVLAHNRRDAQGSPILRKEEFKDECQLQVLKEQAGEKSPQGREKWALQVLEELPLMRWETRKTEELQDLCEEAGEIQDSELRVLEKDSEKKDLHVLVESAGEMDDDEEYSSELMNLASFHWRTPKTEISQTLEEIDVENSGEQPKDWKNSDFHLSYSNDDFSPCEISTASSPTSTVSLPLMHMSQDDPVRQRLLFKKTLLSIWKMVASHRYSGPFLKPVSEKQAPGYKDVVKRPVDLYSIKRSLSKGLIQNMVEFQRDLMLMFQNAVMYNSSNHHIHRIAMEMQREVLEQLQMLGEALLCSEEMRAFVRC
ncbi:UNVERIFIED_CONTAM: hypothetical protein K2H54_040813 [Gekko kuhli]